MNLQTMISELRKAGLAEVDIATRLEVAQSTINRIANGKMVPSWPLGEKIRELHSEVRGNAA